MTQMTTAQSAPGAVIQKLPDKDTLTPEYQSFNNTNANLAEHGLEEDRTWQTEQDSPPTSLSVQIGGGHYKNFAIQPVEFCQKNRLNYCEANVVKYICRWREKGGRESLEKAKHYIDMLIELEDL